MMNNSPGLGRSFGNKNQSRYEEEGGYGGTKSSFNQTQGTLGGNNSASLKGKLMSLEVNLISVISVFSLHRK